ncbi:hemerythrin domain-containing protein [Streptomyces sp. NPDC007264]|uniref:hemerythrin domain-containing protein n=1 Tax=Streptomyces sp. NPDC007264 TaxID=3364777 RepID=UPI0036D9156B
MRAHRVNAVTASAAALALGVAAWAWAGAGSGAEPQPSGGTVTEPLRAEHRELVPSIEALAAAAEAVGTASPDEQRKRADSSYAFLTTRLIPHAVAEDRVLYATVDSLLAGRGKTRATDTMRRDHAQVGTLTAELGRLRGRLDRAAPGPDVREDLRRVLYSLHAIVALHFAKEEEVYLPLLDRELPPERAREMFQRMEAAEKQARGGGKAPH